MNIELALRNYELLKNLPPSTKLYAKNDELSFDDRWIGGVRRYIDGSSRSDMIIPIEKTFMSLGVHKLVSNDELLQTIEQLREKLMTLYPFDSDNEDIYFMLNRCKSYIEWLKRSGELLETPTPTLPKTLKFFIGNTEYKTDLAFNSEEFPALGDVTPEFKIAKVEEYTFPENYAIMETEEIEVINRSPEFEECMKALDELIQELQSNASENASETTSENASETTTKNASEPTIEPIQITPSISTLDICVNQFSTRVQTEVLPILEIVTKEMLQSIAEECKKEIETKVESMQIRRRFVSKSKLNEKFDVPSISKFEFADATNIKDDHRIQIESDEEIQSDNDDNESENDNESDEESEELEVFPGITCVERLFSGLNRDVTSIMSSVDSMFKRMSDVVNKYI